MNNLKLVMRVHMASGMSKRFGTNKLLASFNNNTLFENAINISRFVSFGKTLAVTRHDELVQICEREHIHCIKHNMPYRNDMVHLGVSHIIKESCCQKNNCTQGILFLPSDQPLITKTSLQLLCLLFIYYNSSHFACNNADKSSNSTTSSSSLTTTSKSWIWLPSLSVPIGSYRETSFDVFFFARKCINSSLSIHLAA